MGDTAVTCGAEAHVRGEVAAIGVVAGALRVADEAGHQQAAELLARIARAKRAVEQQRQFFVRPLNDQVKAINAKFKAMGDPLDRADQALRTKVLDYVRARERARSEEEARRRAEHDAKVREARALGEAAPAPVQPLAVPVAPSTARAASGSVGIVKIWDFEVLDRGQVPVEYLQVDEKSVRAAVRGGARAIPGLRIFERETTQVRA